MPAGSTDCIAGHDVIDYIAAAFRDSPIQTDRTVGVEGLALEIEVMRSHLRQIAAERVACNRYIGRCLAGTEMLLFA